MKVSVALCTFNGEAFLPTQLRSILDQTRPPDEMIIADDGSTDQTATILQQFASSAPFPVVLDLHGQRLGSSRNFDRAIAQCNGDWIALADQDDFWQPNKLNRLTTEAKRLPELVCLFTDGWAANERLESTGRTIWQLLPFTAKMQRQFVTGQGGRLLLRYNVATGATMMFRSELRTGFSPIPPEWLHDAWIALWATQFGQVLPLDEPLIRYRGHAQQQVGISGRTVRRQMKAAFRSGQQEIYQQTARRFELLLDRLKPYSERLIDADFFTALECRIALARQQAEMRGSWRVDRVARAVPHLLRGDYHRYAHGLRSFAVDCCL